MDLLKGIVKLNENPREEDIMKIVEYDFKDEFAAELNKKVPNDKKFCELEDLEKWLIYKYKSSVLDIDCDKSSLATRIYKEAWGFLKYGNIQYQFVNFESFKEKFNKQEKLYEIEVKGVLYNGETLNSFSTPLKHYLYLNKENLKGTVEKKLLENYFNISNEIDKELKLFSRLTGTMGNFMPVPLYFNKGRVEKTSDYWDLTLLGIYNYYTSGKSCEFLKTFLSDIKSNGKTRPQSVVISFSENRWLSNFETWSDFVKANYLQDFVSGNEEIGFGKPIMFWDMHSFMNKDPKSKEDISQFFRKVNFMISNRGRRICRALKDKAEFK